MKMTSMLSMIVPLALVLMGGLLTAEFFLARKSRRAGLIIPVTVTAAMLILSLLFGGIAAFSFLPLILWTFIVFGIGRFAAYLARRKHLSELDKMNLDDL